MKTYNKILLLILIGIFIGTISCSDMNDIHDVYLKDGEIIYIAKIDTLVVHPGYKRTKFKFWVSDPRAKEVSLKWYPYDDSMTIVLERTTAKTDTFEVIIGDEINLVEGNYTFIITTNDKLGNYSVPFEDGVYIYGDLYSASLLNKRLINVEYDNDIKELSLSFDQFIRDGEIGIELFYTDIDGLASDSVILTRDISDLIILNNINVDDPIHYRTLYKPTANAIDIFYSKKQTIQINDL